MKPQVVALPLFVSCIALLAHCAQSASTLPTTSTPAPVASASASDSSQLPDPSPPAPVATAPACTSQKVAIPAVIQSDIDVPVPDIVDSPTPSMARFYEKLAKALRGKGQVRIGFYGDSNMTLDLITGAMRRSIQQTYGDSGHGFVALGNPWPHYKHMDVKHGVVGRIGWKEIAISTHGIADNLYSFAGIAAQSTASKVKAFVETSGPNAPIGKTASLFEIHYLKHPNFGSFDVYVDGQKTKSVATNAATPSADVVRIETTDAPHRVELQVTTIEPVRLFGIALERSQPGVIVDSLGIGGVSSAALSKAKPGVYSQSLANRNYDLIIFLLGTNTPSSANQPGEMKKVIENLRAGIPDLNILIMSPPDHIKTSNDTHSDPLTRKIVEQMKTIAKDNNTAFWDFWSAMGGDGSMHKFYKKKWNLWSDCYHLSEEGSAYMASRIVNALWKDLNRWVEANPTKTCDSTPAAPANASASPSVTK